MRWFGGLRARIEFATPRISFYRCTPPLAQRAQRLNLEIPQFVPSPSLCSVLALNGLQSLAEWLKPSLGG